MSGSKIAFSKSTPKAIAASATTHDIILGIYEFDLKLIKRLPAIKEAIPCCQVSNHNELFLWIGVIIRVSSHVVLCLFQVM